MDRKAPKYKRIKNYLIQGIVSRQFCDILPSENQLSDKFKVSRMTARRALSELEREGTVERFPGKGTFVCRPGHYTRGFFRIRPFKKWAEDLDATLRTQVLESRIIEAPEKVSNILKYKDQIIFLRILNYLDESPVRYAVRYLRADQCAGILWENLEKDSIHDILINRYHLPLTKVDQRMTAVALDTELAALFGEKTGHPAFYFQRLTYSFEMPITYVEYYMRGDMAFHDTFTPQLEKSDFGFMNGNGKADTTANK